MPRIDPHTGCKVITLSEMIAKDAQRKGVPVEQEAEDFWADFAKMQAEDERMTRERLTKDALSILQKAAKEHNEADPFGEYERAPYPVRLVCVLETESYGGLKRQSEGLEAECVADDGKTYRYHFVEQHWAGSYMEPPDYDFDFGWVRVTRWQRFCEIVSWVGYGIKRRWRSLKPIFAR